MLVLVTGPTGKVGRTFIDRFLADPRFTSGDIRALCHKRVLEGSPRLEIRRGSIADREVAADAVAGVTHVVHLATCKEMPAEVMDVAVKGLFWLLEAFRCSSEARQFILIGGDAAVGHFHHDHGAPITEAAPHRAYPGCYALSKVLEEVLVQQYRIQYGVNACCLRAPWIMEKDDFKHTLSFGDDIFGAPVWKDEVGAPAAARYCNSGTVPILLDKNDRPLKRNFIHVDDLVSAILAAIDHPAAAGELFNIAMDAPIDYGEVAAYLARTRGLPSVPVPSHYSSNWLDNSKAKYLLGWRPQIDMARLIDSSWDYQRSADDPRKVWYPG
jgi:nucleoside-diphosphate-sugar epimerase